MRQASGRWYGGELVQKPKLVVAKRPRAKTSQARGHGAFRVCACWRRLSWPGDEHFAAEVVM